MVKNFNDFTTEDLAKLRTEVVLGSIYISDYRNSFGISADSMCSFFDGFLDYIWELAKEENSEHDWTYNEVYEKFDNIENLKCWYYCYDSFDWVTYEEEGDD